MLVGKGIYPEISSCRYSVLASTTCVGGSGGAVATVPCAGKHPFQLIRIPYLTTIVKGVKHPPP